MTYEEALRTLNLDRGCSRVEIRQAYLDMVKVWHPDRFQHDPGLRAKADRALRDVNQAYRVLQGRVRQDGPGVQQEDPGTRQTVETPQTGVHRTVSQAPARHWSPVSIAAAALFGLAVGSLGALAVWWPSVPDVDSSQAVVHDAPADIALVPAASDAIEKDARARPLSGAEMITPRHTGGSVLIVQSNERRDAVVVLAEPEGISRALYVRAGERVTAVNVGSGTYRVRFMLGNGWDDGSFRRDATYDELDQDVVFEESGQADSTQHTRLTIALRSAADGRTGRRTVTPFVLPK